MLHLLHFLHVIAFVLCRVTAKDATLFIKIWKYQKLFVHLQSRNEKSIMTQEEKVKYWLNIAN